jgi:hypothetical protein
MGVTTALVIGLTSAAAALGPQVSSATASFPLIGASIAAFAKAANRPAAGVGLCADGGRALRLRRLLAYRRGGAAAHGGSPRPPARSR